MIDYPGREFHEKLEAHRKAMHEAINRMRRTLLWALWLMPFGVAMLVWSGYLHHSWWNSTCASMMAASWGMNLGTYVYNYRKRP